MKKAILVDSFSNYSLHQMYNASLAAVLDKVFESIDYYVGLDQKKAIEFHLRNCGKELLPNVKFRNIYVPSGESRFCLIMRYLIGATINLFLLVFSDRRRVIILNNNNPFSLIPYKVVNFFIRRIVFIVSHGELEFMRSETVGFRLNAFYRFLGWLLRIGFRIFPTSKYFFYIVNGDSIKQNLLNYRFIREEQVIVIDHPYLFSDKPIFEINDCDDKRVIRAGSLGVFSKPKGALNLLELSKRFALNERITFHVVGGISRLQINTDDFPNVTFHSGERNFIDGDEYLKLVSTLDYVLFFYPDTMYKLTASGAIFDAINLNKPIIALSNDYFSYLFEKHPGIGILCSSLDQMTSEIGKLLNGDNNVRLYVSGIRETKHHHSVDNVSKQLSSNLRSLGLLEYYS